MCSCTWTCTCVLGLSDSVRHMQDEHGASELRHFLQRADRIKLPWGTACLSWGCDDGASAAGGTLMHLQIMLQFLKVSDSGVHTRAAASNQSHHTVQI
jgi:hypothetical protein